MFQLGRDRSRGHGSSCRKIMPAIDQKCFARKQTTSHGRPRLVLRVIACMEVNETGHAQRLNILKQRPRKWFFREEVDFLASLAFVVNKCGHTIAIYR